MQVILVALLFLASRLWLLCGFQASGSDVQAYAGAARDGAAAESAGKSLHNFIRDDFERSKNEALSKGLAPPPPEFGVFEYPPLMVPLLMLPAHGLLIPGRPPRDWYGTYLFRFRAIQFALDLGIFAIVALCCRRLFPKEGKGTQALRLGVYAGLGLLLPHILYDRLDMPVAFLISLAFLCLVRGRFALSWTLLATAAALKLVALALLPLWILGALPRAALSSRRLFFRGAWPHFVAFCAVLVGIMTLLVTHYGRASLDFLGYHSSRGLQIESVLAAPLMLAGKLGMALEFNDDFNSINLATPLSAVLAQLSPILIVFACAYVLVLSHGILSRVRGNPADAATADSPLARTRPKAFAALTLLTFLAILLPCKVLSPQYFIWLFPFAALVPLRGRNLAACWTGWGVLVALTTALFPYLLKDLAGIVPIGGGERLFTGPTYLAVTTLVARDGLLVVLACSLALQLRPCARH